MDYSYKQLSANDTELLKKLTIVFGDAFEDSDTYQGARPSDSYLTSLLSKPHFIALVALQEGEVVGGIAAYELEKFEQDRREIYMYDLAVSEQHRRRGVAKSLIAKLQEIARKRNAYIIYVQADLGDDAAIQLYESVGKREEVLHFDIPV